MSGPPLWNRFEREVIEPGNCLHCGACVGLAPQLLRFEETSRGPLPVWKQNVGAELASARGQASCPPTPRCSARPERSFGVLD